MFKKARWVWNKLMLKSNQKLLAIYFQKNKNLFEINEANLFIGPDTHKYDLQSKFHVNGSSFNYPAIEISIHNDVYILGEGKLPLINNKVAVPLLSTSNYKEKLLHLNLSDVLTINKLKNTSELRKGSFILLVNRWSRNYHHWLCELLPTLIAAREHAFREIIPIIDSAPTKFQKETLRLLGFDMIVTDTNIKLSRLIAIRNIRIREDDWPYSIIEPTLLANLRASILKNILTPNETEDFDMLWISRKDDNNRHVINEEDLFHQAHFKIKILHPSRTNLNDQVYFSSKAKLIAGPHGAGLSNAIWSHATLIEIGPPDGINNTFKGMAASLQTQHYYFKAESTGFNLLKKRKNLKLNIQQFLKEIKDHGLLRLG